MQPVRDTGSLCAPEPSRQRRLRQRVFELALVQEEPRGQDVRHPEVRVDLERPSNQAGDLVVSPRLEPEVPGQGRDELRERIEAHGDVDLGESFVETADVRQQAPQHLVRPRVARIAGDHPPAVLFRRRPVPVAPKPQARER
jgi:hypothetical protein